MKKVLSLLLVAIMLLPLIQGLTFEANAAQYVLYWPVPTNVVAIGKYSSKFGPRTAPTTGASTNHRGVDLPARSGTPVYSLSDGVVTAIGSTSARGNYVVIYHASIGLSSLYQHLTCATVQVGDVIAGGSQVAISGNTGVGTGAHLHFGVMVGKATNPNHDQPGYNMAIDPLGSNITYVPSSGNNSITDNPDSYTVPTRVLSYTSPVMTGNDVKWVQAVLFQLGYTVGIDGSFGPATSNTVKQFQTDSGLTANGSVDAATLAKLVELWNYKKAGNFNITLNCWVSNTEFGDATDTFYFNTPYYLNFEIVDSNTGRKINSLISKTYTVVMAFFNPDGSVHSTVSLASTDSGTLSAIPAASGTYLAAVAVVGDLTLNYEYRFAPQQAASTSNINIALNSWVSKTQFGDAVDTFYINESYYLNYELIDTVTGKRINSLVSKTYTTCIAFFNPDGSVLSTVMLSSADNGSLEGIPATTGTYLAAVAVVGDITLNTEYYFNASITPPATYTVTYHSNGGSTAPSSQTANTGTTINLSSTIPTRAGYDFAGWSETGNYYSTIYQPGDAFTATSDITLYANWTPKTYTITYNANGGSGAPGSQTKTHDTAVTLSSTIPTRSGYTFKGWATSSTATSATYAAGASYTANANTTLYAVWEQNVSLSSISVYSNPSKTSYYIGDALDSSGLTIKLNYSNGTTGNITSGFSISGFDSSTAGNKNVTVSYSGLTTSFSVTIIKPTITLSPSNISMFTGNTASITATTVPGSQSITWTSSDTSVASVNNGVITSKTAGYTTITAQFVYNGITYKSTCNVSVNCTHANTTVHPAVSSSCTVQGNIEYTTCNDCGDVISGFDTKLPLGNHSGETYVVGQKNATITDEGFTGDVYCSECNELITAGTVIPKLIIRGDLNGDGNVNSIDVSLLGRVIKGVDITVTDGADVNGDGAINNLDYSMLTRMIKGVA